MWGAEEENQKTGKRVKKKGELRKNKERKKRLEKERLRELEKAWGGCEKEIEREKLQGSEGHWRGRKKLRKKKENTRRLGEGWRLSKEEIQVTGQRFSHHLHDSPRIIAHPKTFTRIEVNPSLFLVLGRTFMLASRSGDVCVRSCGFLFMVAICCC